MGTEKIQILSVDGGKIIIRKLSIDKSKPHYYNHAHGLWECSSKAKKDSNFFLYSCLKEALEHKRKLELGLIGIDLYINSYYDEKSNKFKDIILTQE